MLTTCLPQAHAQYPVKDKSHNKWSRILRDVQVASTAFYYYTSLVAEGISRIQDFVATTVSVVNGVIKNLRLVQELIKIQDEITALVQKSIEVVSSPIDTDGDGVDDLDFLDKWKHIQILLAIGGEASNLWDLFLNIIGEDSTIMDDKGRLTLLQDAYKDAVKIKVSIKVHLRRINKEIYRYQRQRKEVETFSKLFSALNQNPNQYHLIA